jgi:hypothetical protein
LLSISQLLGKTDKLLFLSRASNQLGFRDFPDGFSIDEYEIDKDHWQEGFVGLDPTEI